MVVKDYFKDFTVRNNTSAYMSTWILLKLIVSHILPSSTSLLI